MLSVKNESNELSFEISEVKLTISLNWGRKEEVNIKDQF